MLQDGSVFQLTSELLHSNSNDVNFFKHSREKLANQILGISNPVLSLDNELSEDGRDIVKYSVSFGIVIWRRYIICKKVVKPIQLSS